MGSGKGRPVKIITDNSVETIVFGKTEINNDSQCHLSPSWVPIAIRVVRDLNMCVHWHWERKTASQWEAKTIFCNLVTSKGEKIKKVLPTLSNDMDKGWKRWHVKIIEEWCRIMVFGIADMNFGLGDMNRYIPDVDL